MFWIFLLACVGATHIIVDGSIFARLRGKVVSWNRPWLTELISCYQCAGMWIGFILGLIMQPIAWETTWTVIRVWLALIATPCICGFAGSFASMAGAALLNYLDAPAMAVKKINEQHQA